MCHCISLLKSLVLFFMDVNLSPPCQPNSLCCCPHISQSMLTPPTIELVQVSITILSVARVGEKSISLCPHHNHHHVGVKSGIMFFFRYCLWKCFLFLRQISIFSFFLKTYFFLYILLWIIVGTFCTFQHLKTKNKRKKINKQKITDIVVTM